MLYATRKQIEDQDRLFVTSGGQRGASIDLDDLPLTFGAGADCDILLLADEAGEAELTLKLASDDLVEATTINGDILIGGRRLKEGASRLLGRNTLITLGNTQLAITGSLQETDDTRKRKDRRAAQLGWAASVAMVVATTGAVALTAGGINNEFPTVQTVYSSQADSSSVMPVLASGSLEEQLVKQDFASLTVSSDRSEGVILVEGEIRHSQAERWNEVQKWFDATYGATVQLEARLTIEDDAITLPFSVQSIWMVPHPRLTLHDGSQSRVGDILPGGWHLDAINENGVNISRDGEKLTLSL